jgi:hypothetical protein
MARQEVLWNFYKKGIISNEALAEIKKINMDKELRKRTLDSEPMASCKSEQMAVYATLQIVETLFKKIDDLFYGTYKGTMTAFDTSNLYLGNVGKQMGILLQSLKASETNLRNAISQNTVNNAKLLKQESLRINKILTILEGTGAMGGAGKDLTENVRNDLKKATKIIREGSTSDLKELEQTIIRTLHKRDEAFVKAVGEQYKELVTEVSKAAPKGAPAAAAAAMPSDLKDQLTGMSENMDILGDKLEAMQTSIDSLVEGKPDDQSAKMLEMLEDNAQENAELNEAQTQVITEQIEALHADLETFQKDTDKRMDDLDSKFGRDIKDLRDLLNTVRADIELMKSLLAKMGK